MPAKQILVVHVPRQHLDFVRSKGLIPVQVDSWRKDALHKTPLKEIICTSSGLDPLRYGIRNAYVPIQVPSDRDRGENLLMHYFTSFFSWSFHKAVTEEGFAGNPGVHLAVNLMPFCFPASVADKIIKGLRKFLETTEAARKGCVHITFLTRNSCSFQNSQFYRDTVSKDTYNVKFSLVDYRGHHCEGMSQVRKPIGRELFHNMLVGNDKWFYRQLVYGTNAFIGHFIMPNSHVRTHYDLTEFVREDGIYEFLYRRIDETIGMRSNVIVVYHGIERVALQRLSSQLVRHSERFTDAIEFQGKIRPEDVMGADAVLILTDIVNTGRSVKEVYDKICALRESKEDVFCYSVIAMENSPEAGLGMEILAAARIQRKYYETDKKKCLLCQLAQPSTEVHKAEDFRVVHPDQLTPYDFWEMVFDCRALKRKEQEHTGRILAYRVETKDIIERYRHWLKNVLKYKLESAMPRRVPTKILTIREKGGVAFSALVCLALGLNTKVIMPVGRDELHRLMLPSAQTSEPGLLAQERVLLVDDGINEGNTIRMLSNYCTKHGADPIGVAVLDSRLGESELKRLRAYMGRAPIVYLYAWPGKVIHYDTLKNS